VDVIKYTETVFSEKGKSGIMTPDADGYFTVVVGALNSYNSAGEFYTAKDVVQLFDGSSHFQRRIKSGALYAELGHPKKQLNQSMEQFYNRVVTIDEKSICGHFSEVWLDFNFGKQHPELNAPDMIAIMAKVKPAGVNANALQLAFENPKQNLPFSIRGLTENKYINNRVERRLTNIITFDYVTEPGISIADKINAPGLENRRVARVASEAYSLREGTDTMIDRELMKRVLTNQLTSVGMESSNRELFNDILRTVNGGQPSKASRLAAW
jgi:hypothetical protein